MILFLALVWSAESFAAPAPKGGLVLPSGDVAVFGARQRDGGTALVMNATKDAGRTWHEVGVVVRDPLPNVDLGDGNAVRLKDGRIWAVFRHNHAPKDYAVEIAESSDEGKTWRLHSTVEISKPQGAGPSRGLWAPFLFVNRKGEVQCYYDDEAAPAAGAWSGHQWVSMRPWKDGRWSARTTVAREPGDALSRDGMPSVIQFEGGRVLCAVEAVRAKEPHAGLLRLFRSDDDGHTWGPPSVLYAPKDARFHAFAPSLVRLPDRIVCVFATNEDRTDSRRSGTPAHRMMLDIKAIESRDGGKTWSSPVLVYAGTHRNYLPSVVALSKGRLLATFLDFDKGPRAVEGILP